MFLSTGTGHYVNTEHILFVVPPWHVAIVRAEKAARERGQFYDFTRHFPTKGVIVLDTGEVIRIAKRPKDFVMAEDVEVSIDNVHKAMV